MARTRFGIQALFVGYRTTVAMELTCLLTFSGFTKRKSGDLRLVLTPLRERLQVSCGLLQVKP
jgi:hypothetical protein